MIKPYGIANRRNNEREASPRRKIALAEYHCFSGQLEKAIQEAGLYLACPDVACRFSARLIYAYAMYPPVSSNVPGML